MTGSNYKIPMRTIIVVLSVLSLMSIVTWIKGRRNAEVAERQSWGYFSTSINRSKDLRLFEVALDIKPGEIRCGETRIVFRDAWVERHAKWFYRWTWFFRPKATDEFQIVIVADRQNEGPDYFNLSLRKSGKSFDLVTGEYWVAKLDHALDSEGIEIDCALGGGKETVRLKPRVSAN